MGWYFVKAVVDFSVLNCKGCFNCLINYNFHLKPLYFNY
jgi:hypothetical protein